MSATQVSRFHFALLRPIQQGKNNRSVQRIAFILFLLLATLSNARATTVWIDTDVSIGSPFREVDDAFALLLAFRCSNLNIVGISTTYGNARLARTTVIARKAITEFAGSGHLPRVYPGARSRRDFRVETAASCGLAEALRKNRRLVYIALGPLTNLAAFETRHPDLAQRIERVIIVGGKSDATSLRFGSRHPIQIHDANVFKDPEAVRHLLQTRIPITLMPVETAAELMLDENDLNAIGRSGAGGRFLQKRSRIWLWFWTKLVGTKGAPIFDAAAILAAARPGEVVLERMYAAVNSTGDLVVSKDRNASARPVLYGRRLAANANRFVRKKLRGTTR